MTTTTTEDAVTTPPKEHTFGPPHHTPIGPGDAQQERPMYVVIACPRCRKAKVVEVARKTTTCPSCGRTLELRDLRGQPADTLDEAQAIAGLTNARLAGREREFVTAIVAPAPRDAKHDDRWSAAAAAARSARSETSRADAIARALGEFTDADLERAFGLAGLSRPEHHLTRMLRTHVVFEPAAGRYRVC